MASIELHRFIDCSLHRLRDIESATHVILGDLGPVLLGPRGVQDQLARLGDLLQHLTHLPLNITKGYTMREMVRLEGRYAW